MLFPDPRFRSPTAEGGFGGFGLTYACEDVRSAQEELAALLAQAQAAKLLTVHWFTADEGHPIAVEAQSVYRQVIDRNLVLFSDDACAEAANRLKEQSEKMRGLLAYNKVDDVVYTPPTDSPYQNGNPDTLDKLKPLFISGAVILGVVMLIPLAYQLAGSIGLVRKVAKKRYAGRRR